MVFKNINDAPGTVNLRPSGPGFANGAGGALPKGLCASAPAGSPAAVCDLAASRERVSPDLGNAYPAPGLVRLDDRFHHEVRV
jgi:hypothetical protein